VTDSRRSGDLAQFERESRSLLGTERTVFRMGTGPAVIVMSEMPGITPRVLGFGERVAELGCTAVVPHLFGEPGRDPDAGGRLGLLTYALSSAIPVCISREFTVLATGRTSPIITWLRALARYEHERCGGPGVGAVGMCFTGGFALAMSTIPEVVAPVMAQPSLPFAIGRTRAGAVDISESDMDLVESRCAAGDLTVVGLRFCGDRMVPGARFRALEERLGDAFIAVELADESANPDASMSPHSTLTEHLIDVEGEPTRDGLDAVLEHFRTRLLAPT
jgi:dienelactone hydrolase